MLIFDIFNEIIKFLLLSNIILLPLKVQLSKITDKNLKRLISHFSILRVPALSFSSRFLRRNKSQRNHKRRKKNNKLCGRTYKRRTQMVNLFAGHRPLPFANFNQHFYVLSALLPFQIFQ